MYSGILLLQAGAGQSPITSFIFIGAMFLVFWLFIIRPQSKRQKEQNQFMTNLQKGDEVVTTSGILGRITKMEDQIVTIDAGNKVYLNITRSSISKEMTESVYGRGKAAPSSGKTE